MVCVTVAQNMDRKVINE